MEYPKTENLFTRDDKSHKLNMGDFRLDYFEQIAYWLVTEKVDGTNIRIILDWKYDIKSASFFPELSFRGRSDAAPVPGEATAKREDVGLAKYLKETVTLEQVYFTIATITNMPVSDLFERPVKAVLYGEGYGAGIQKGGVYNSEQSFRMFDIVTYRPEVISFDFTEVLWGEPYWRPWSDVAYTATALGLKTVPLLGARRTVTDIIEGMGYNSYDDKLGFKSLVARDENPDHPAVVDAEGIVARTDPYLFDSRGNRVMFKLKTKDIPTSVVK